MPFYDDFDAPLIDLPAETEISSIYISDIAGIRDLDSADENLTNLLALTDDDTSDTPLIIDQDSADVFVFAAYQTSPNSTAFTGQNAQPTPQPEEEPDPETQPYKVYNPARHDAMMSSIRNLDLLGS